MVDFQSRDTRRGPTVDDDSEDESDGASSEDGATEADDAADTAGEGDGTDSAGDATTADPETTAETERTEADADPLADEAGGPVGESDPLAEEPTGATGDADPLADEAGGPAGESDPLVDQAGGAAGETADDPLADTVGSEDGAAEGGDTEAAVAAGDTEVTATAGDTETTPSDTEAAGTSQQPTPARAVDVAVVTVGGDRATLEDTVTDAFEGAGHAVVRRERLRGGYDAIRQMVDTLVGEDVDVVVTVGGVGLAADEMAIEAVHPLLEKALPGFGEAFRARLADHIGTGIVGVRSAAGLSDGTLVFCLPGNVEAAGLAVREIIATEAPVLVDQLEG